MKFSKYLKNSGLKVTPQRLAILNVIATRGHATIDEIYDDVLKIYASISLATIYKNLLAMCEVGILNELKIHLQKQRYEINDCEHAHMVCIDCGKLEDFAFQAQKVFLAQEILLQTPLDFQVSYVCATFYGKCKDCLKEER